MHLAITGSIATDHLMTFPGKFVDSLVPDQLDKISLSFLVDDLDVRRGGCGANIAFALAKLGHRALLVGAVGRDFETEYRGWLDAAGVDTSGILVSETRHTARFVCTTDTELAQFATFYAGAMSESRDIDLLSVGSGYDLVLIGPDDPDGMLRHTRACRDNGIPFAADPSQQLAWADGDVIRDLIDGAAYLFSNDYEASLIQQKTGWTAEDVRAHVGTQIITRGKNGATVLPADGDPIEVKAIEGVVAVDPTGVGDSFRAGFLAGIAAGLGFERSAQIGCTIAASVVETTGTQEYVLEREGFLKRLGAAYGDSARTEVDAALSLA
ncbi:carbohydrate kinase family protein [Aeromicrobium wangtongii]|uniref:carbohydrate kinase family protein n=1 Tax=Aeromicrobium wangtongii TaxID=2969247 RepID=UPI002017A5AF|nr:carbohydrate kinase family protein [Aeromicrobium wangtongii]MCL3818424.1 carbohydrate kinase family protein [Aeromicrobium wangtongii]